MVKEFTQKQVEISFRKFSDYAEDLDSSDYNTFDSHLSIFLNHCENDEIMRTITTPLKNAEVFDKCDKEFLSKGGSMVGSSKITFPEDEYEMDSYIYQLLLKLKNKERDITNITVRAYGANGLSESVYWFNEKVTSKLTRSLKYKLEEIDERIEREVKEGENIPVNLLIVFQDNRINIKNSKITGDAVIGKDAQIKKN